MKKLALAAVLALSSSAAYAQSFEIPINGGVARIELNDRCRNDLCASVSWSERGSRGERREFRLPGISAKTLSKMIDTYAPGSSNEQDDEDDADTREVERQSPPPAVGSKRRPAPSGAPTSSPPGETRLSGQPSSGPNPMLAGPEPAPADPGQPATEPQASPAPQATLAPEPAPAAGAKVAAVAPTPAPDAKAARRSPVGAWLVEDGEGQIRIEECGANLCGYVSAAKNPGEKDRKNPDPELRGRSVMGMPILIDMKPSGNRWNGRIYNAKDGKTYSANISLKSGDTLRVEGCAFGGLICGGQTWSRVN